MPPHDPQLSLVVSPPPQLALRTSSLGYLGGGLASPVTVAAAVFMTCLGLGYLGIAGAALALVSVVMLTVTATRYQFVRRHLDRQAVAREHAIRESTRLRRLRPTGPTRQAQYVELRDLVEQVEKTTQREAERFELQALLEHFVRLSVTHQRFVEALRLAGTREVPMAFSELGAPIKPSPRRREIVARRIAHRTECQDHLAALADELEAVDELIRLVAQRAACPDLDDDFGREVERRLWELDEVDAAYAQLSA